MGSEATAGGGGAELLSLEEEAQLLKYYAGRLQHICRELRLPRRVLGTAATYLKRIYLALTCLEQDPQQLLLTCLYLACKTEEHYISAAELGRLTGVRADVILKTELTALQALKFDLIVYSPYKAVEGFLDDVRDAAERCGGAGADAGAEAAAGLDARTAALGEEQLARARQGAMGAADALMMSDAPLLHAPGRLALAALRSGFSKVGVKLQRYVERVAQRGSGGDEGGVALPRLQAALAELDRLGTEGAQSVDQARVQAANQRLKACRALLAEGGGGKGRAKGDKQARKAAKAAEQRGEAEAGSQATGEPALKRPRESD